MYFLAINQLKKEFKSLELSLEFDEQEEWSEAEIAAGYLIQSGKWGEHSAMVIKANSEEEAMVVAKRDPLFQYDLVNIELIGFGNSLPYLEKKHQQVTSVKETTEIDQILELDHLTSKLLSLDEVTSFNPGSLNPDPTGSLVTKKQGKESVILVLDGVVEAMVDYKLEAVQKFKTLKVQESTSQNKAAVKSILNQFTTD